MKDLITAITTTLRTVTPKVHFDSLPDESFFNDHSIVFTLSNTDKASVIENPELLNNYFCEVRINSAKISKTNSSNDETNRVLNLYKPVKDAMYSLDVSYIKCVTEDFSFYSNNQIWTYYLRFEIMTG